jgi:DNA-binding MarR family transcriptional regulator
MSAILHARSAIRCPSGTRFPHPAGSPGDDEKPGFARPVSARSRLRCRAATVAPPALGRAGRSHRPWFTGCVAQTRAEKQAGESALAALRAMVSIGESTLEQVTEHLTLTQFRALRIVVEQTPVTMSRVAAELGMNPSSVTRACDRLATLELLHRAQNPLNKREVLIAPTGKGRQVVKDVDAHRRTVLTGILDRLDPETRAGVVTAFARFADAAAEAEATTEHGRKPRPETLRASRNLSSTT